MKNIFLFLTISFLIVGLKAQTIDDDLLNACFENNDKKVFDLLREGANPNAKTQFGVTPLMYSVQNGNYFVTKILLESGADPDISGEMAQPPIINAILNKDTALVYLLLENGANPNIVDKSTEKTALIYAIEQRSFIITDLLLYYGANPNRKSGDDYPLTRSIELNADTLIVKLLIEKGAKMNFYFDNGITPIIYCVMYNNLQYAKILLNSGANPKITDTIKNQNALDYSFEFHLKEMTKLLLPYFSSDIKKYHNSALDKNYSWAANYIRQTTGKKLLMPHFSHFFINNQLVFTYDDVFWGFKFGFNEARYNLDIKFGVLPRLWRKRVFIEQSENNYLQVWEHRTIMVGEINKYFNLSYNDYSVRGIYIGFSANYSIGSYDGINTRILKPLVPSFEIGWWNRVRNFKSSIGYKYMPIQTRFPHYLTINLSLLIPLKK